MKWLDGFTCNYGFFNYTNIKVHLINLELLLEFKNFLNVFIVVAKMLLKHKRVILFEILQALYFAMYLTTISVYAILDLDNKIKCVY